MLAAMHTLVYTAFSILHRKLLHATRGMKHNAHRGESGVQLCGVGRVAGSFVVTRILWRLHVK